MDRTRTRGCFAVDRISNLPCNVIDHILKYLPLRDAVRTSILSRGWQYKWLTVPYLVFDENFGENILDEYNIESIIYQILLLHRGHIIKFIFEVGDSNMYCAVNHWLHFLSKHGVEQLTLHLTYSTQVMPYHLFTFDQLKHFYLVGCKLRPPSAFKGFGKLVTLGLKYVDIEPGELGRFISKCPMLEHLNLDDYHCRTTFSDFQINAPNLKSFSFSGTCPPICFRSTLVLEDVSISLNVPAKFQGPQTNLTEFFGPILSIKKLKLNCHFLQLLGRGGVTQKLPNNLSHLRVLELSSVDFVTIDVVACALYLIRSSPNLRSLEIRSTAEPDGDRKPALEFLKEQQKCKLSHLENVTIDGFLGSEPEMEFVKLLLLSATALLKLEIKLSYWVRYSTEKESCILKGLARLRRASSEAEIIM